MSWKSTGAPCGKKKNTHKKKTLPLILKQLYIHVYTLLPDCVPHSASVTTVWGLRKPFHYRWQRLGKHSKALEFSRALSRLLSPGNIFLPDRKRCCLIGYVWFSESVCVFFSPSANERAAILRVSIKGTRVRRSHITTLSTQAATLTRSLSAQQTLTHSV